ncbi:unnamed protein product [Lepeophtheirus salmonis]|uniref:(salmon louse) hypothetical protein n=1 Tax=Lepeophtheirus salmonis TaxID=72036 RepID=A0A817FF02_LEPSM|nr:unnamed protein product [Lepeophtheirus salmonis]
MEAKIVSSSKDEEQDLLAITFEEHRFLEKKKLGHGSDDGFKIIFLFLLGVNNVQTYALSRLLFDESGECTDPTVFLMARALSMTSSPRGQPTWVVLEEANMSGARRGHRWQSWMDEFNLYTSLYGELSAERKKTLLLHCAKVEVQQ